MFYNMPGKMTDRKVRAPIWYPEINPEDSRKWSSLHKQTVDVNIQKTSLALTSPQEGGGDQGTSNIDVVNCRGRYGDGYSLDDDKDSEDSGGAMVLKMKRRFILPLDIPELM